MMQTNQSTHREIFPLDFSESDPRLVCPMCGHDYVHPTGIICLPPGGNGRGVLRVDADGVHLDPTVEPTTRGVNIVLEFVCEQGHPFALKFEFHKGQTYVARTDGLRPAGSPINTIWRD